jgi:tricorn protease
MFHETWRIPRDYFYDPGMHGADWPAMREKYAAFLPDLATRGDLNRLLVWLGSELSVGHLYVGGGDSRYDPEPVPGGLPGADLRVANGRYRFARVFGGLNWDPDLRAPLTEPGVDVQNGEYLLAVEGRDLSPPENPYARLENTAGKLVEITIGKSPDGGGPVADYYVDLLRRPRLAYWAMRYGQDLKTPMASIQGPRVMLIDQFAGSGGDLLPWMFRKLGLGTLVGKRTWGGLVGILGFPQLMDGGFVTAPNLAIWTEDGWVVENEGVPPDMEVEQLLAAVEAGGDPQLERAIEIALEQLAADPPERPKRPEYPDKTQ